MARNPSAVLTLAIALAGAGAGALAQTTADGRQAVAMTPGFVGPMPAGMCLVGTPGCTPVNTADPLDLDLLKSPDSVPAAFNAMGGVGALQEQDAKSGTPAQDDLTQKPQIREHVTLDDGTAAFFYTNGDFSYKGRTGPCQTFPECVKYQQERDPADKSVVKETAPPADGSAPKAGAPSSDGPSGQETGRQIALTMNLSGGAEGDADNPPAPGAARTVGAASGGTSGQAAYDRMNHEVQASIDGGDPASLASHLTYVKLRRFALGRKTDAEGRSGMKDLQNAQRQSRDAAGASGASDGDEELTPSPFRASVNQ